MTVWTVLAVLLAVCLAPVVLRVVAALVGREWECETCLFPPFSTACPMCGRDSIRVRARRNGGAPYVVCRCRFCGHRWRSQGAGR